MPVSMQRQGMSAICATVDKCHFAIGKWLKPCSSCKDWFAGGTSWCEWWNQINSCRSHVQLFYYFSLQATEQVLIFSLRIDTTPLSTTAQVRLHMLVQSFMFVFLLLFFFPVSLFWGWMQAHEKISKFEDSAVYLPALDLPRQVVHPEGVLHVAAKELTHHHFHATLFGTGQSVNGAAILQFFPAIAQLQN